MKLNKSVILVLNLHQILTVVCFFLFIHDPINISQTRMAEIIYSNNKKFGCNFPWKIEKNLAFMQNRQPAANPTSQDVTCYPAKDGSLQGLRTTEGVNQNMTAITLQNEDGTWRRKGLARPRHQEVESYIKPWLQIFCKLKIEVYGGKTWSVSKPKTIDFHQPSHLWWTMKKWRPSLMWKKLTVLDAEDRLY